MTTTPHDDVWRLKQLQDHHPFWRNRLFAACEHGQLARDDFRIVFAEYSCYTRNFTRYLCGLMANLEDDLLRAKLAENLWEEGGGADPAERHAEIFRGFLAHGLGVEPTTIEYTAEATTFARAYLEFCQHQEPLASSAFLSLGTEAIVPRMYGIFVRGMRTAGIPEEHLRFFRIHMACDDAHAATLEEIVLHYATQPGWYDRCRAAVDHALTLRTQFFESLFDRLHTTGDPCTAAERPCARCAAPR